MTGKEERKFWVDTLVKIIDTPLEAAAAGELRQRMPKYDVTKWNGAGKDRYAHLEAVGRILCGAAPWLNTEQKDEEEKLRKKYAELARRAIADITDPASPDRAYFSVPVAENGGNPFCQSLVDAAFLSHAIIRGKTELFDKLDQNTKNDLISCLKETRKIRPAHNNWMLFSGMVEAALRTLGEEADLLRVDACLFQHEQWYKGDGVYGDGAMFHWDYYNSYVIQPMIVDICRVFENDFPEGGYGKRRLADAIKRASRYAGVLERTVAPDGTFPAIGRSITYRAGAFQVLAQAVLQDFLPGGVSKAQARDALTAVMHRCFDGKDNFTDDGWLRIGLCGDQPDLGELYICCGSLYLCTAGFLPLGLAEDDAFWSSDHEDRTSVMIWSGRNMPADHSI